MRNFFSWVAETTARVATDATWVFLIVLVLSLGSSLFSIRYLSSLDSDIGELYENDIKGQTYAQNAYASLVSIESELKDIALAESEGARRSAIDSLRADSASLRSLVLKATPTIDSAKYRTLISKSKRDLTSLILAFQNGLGTSPEIPTAEQGRAVLADIRPSLAGLRNDLLTLNDIKRSANRNGIRAVQIQLRISLALTVAILAISLAVRFLIYRASRRAARFGTAEQKTNPGPRGGSKA